MANFLPGREGGRGDFRRVGEKNQVGGVKKIVEEGLQAGENLGGGTHLFGFFLRVVPTSTGNIR